MKTVFTTGEAAKICKVSQQTIIRCFDNGQLKGFRVPGSRFRRIPREALYKFMKDNGIPTDALESGKRKVLLVDDDLELVELMTKVLEEDGRFEVRIATNGFDAAGHYIRTEALVGSCTPYAKVPVPGCSENFAQSGSAASAARASLARQAPAVRSVVHSAKQPRASQRSGVLSSLLGYLIGGRR